MTASVVSANEILRELEERYGPLPVGARRLYHGFLRGWLFLSLRDRERHHFATPPGWAISTYVLDRLRLNGVRAIAIRAGERVYWLEDTQELFRAWDAFVLANRWHSLEVLRSRGQVEYFGGLPETRMFLIRYQQRDFQLVVPDELWRQSLLEEE